jgi:hypothetical protein
MGVPALRHAMDQLRQVAALLQRHVKPKRGRTPYVDYVVAAILLCRVPNLSTRFACLAVGADPVRGHGRVGKYAAYCVESLPPFPERSLPSLTLRAWPSLPKRLRTSPALIA